MSEMNPKNKKKGTGFFLVLPFFLVLAVLTVVSFILPLRPTYSEGEKRELATFPGFSVSALLSGDYFDDITLWFSDTFPGRETWVDVSMYASSFHGYSAVAIDGDLVTADVIPVEQIAAEAETIPEGGEDDTLTTATEEPTEETVEETTEAAEAEWDGVTIDNVEELSLGAAIQIGDAGYNQTGFSQVQSDRYIETVSKFADKMAEKGVRVISAPCPTSVGIMIEPEYLEQINCSDQAEMLAYLHSNMSDNVIKVDTITNLRQHNDEYVYFRTDHHWTQLGAYYAYESLCEAVGFDAPSLDDYTLWNQGDFVGSLYSKVRWPRKLTIDSMDCYVPQGDITMYAHFKDNSAGTEWPLIADRTMLDKNSRYSAFLAADCAMAHVINESIPDAPNVLVVKDSFGNCYVPFLTQNYHNIYAIDYRKYHRMGMAEFCERYDIDDVIVMPYLIATQATDGNDMFRSRLKVY